MKIKRPIIAITENNCKRKITEYHCAVQLHCSSNSDFPIGLKPQLAYKLKLVLKICNPITKHIAIKLEWKEGGGIAAEPKLDSEEKF